MRTSPRILIVDDDNDLCTNLRDILSENNYEVETALCGEDAVSLAQNREFDIALVDIRLEDIPGHEVVKRIAQISKGTEFIYITGYASIEDAVEAVKEKQVVSYEIKPLDMTRLLVMIEQIMARRMAEESTKESERKYRDLFDNANDGICTVDTSGNITICNREFAKMFGYTEKEIMGKNSGDFVHPKDRKRVMEIQKNRFMGKDVPQVYEFLGVKKNGEPIYIEISTSTIKVEDKVIGTRAILRDITQRKQYVEEIQKVNALLGSLGDIQSGFIMQLERSAAFDKLLASLLLLTQSEYGFIGEILHTSQGTPYLKTVAITNIAWNKEMRKFYQENVPNGLKFHNLKTLFGEVMTTGKPVISNSPSTDHRSGGIPEGHPPLKAFLGLPFYYGDSMTGMIGIANRANGYDEKLIAFLKPFLSSCSNILVAYKNEQLREQAEEFLRESESKLSAITSTATDAIIMIDNNGRVSYWNPAAEKMFGYSREEILGQDIGQIIVPLRDRELHKNGFDKFVKTGDGPLIGKTREISAMRKDGSEFPVELSVSGVNIKGLRYAVGIIRDISERKKLAEQLLQSQKMEVVGQLAGGIAHDFNNILTSIINYSNILQMKMGKGNDLLKSYVDAILVSSQRAATLTRGLLSFSRKQIINPVPINLNDIVRKSKGLVSRTICEDIKFTVKLTDKDLPIIADNAQIEQILINLVTNACHVMPKGGELTIRTELREMDDSFVKHYGYGAPGMYAFMSFTDTGTGMDKETQNRIFEPFFTTKEVGKGTGLGLAIIYGIIKQHNGYINVYSEVDIGTTFKIYLPLIREKIKPGKQAEAPVTGGTETVLMAEDDTAVRLALKLILEEYGYTVIEAGDGKEAIEKFIKNKEKIQLLILDVVMPKKKGKEVYEEIKKMRPDIKTIFVSGYTEDIIHTKDIIKQNLNFISKPISPNNLLRKIREVLDD